MKIKKIENRLSFFFLTLAITILNIHNLSILGIIIGSILSIFFIFFMEKLNIYKYKVIKIFLMFLTFFFMTIYLNKITYFIGDNILRNYSLISISLTIIIFTYYLANKGYHTIVKVIMLASYFIIFIFLIGFLFLFPYLNLSNLNINIFTSNNLFKESFYYAIFIVYSYFLIYPLSNTKFQIRDLVINSSYQILSFLSIFSVLGLTLESLYKYSYIVIFKKVSLIGFIERIEIIFSLNYLFIFFFLLVLSFYQIKYNLQYFIKKDKNQSIILIIITILIFCTNLLFT